MASKKMNEKGMTLPEVIVVAAIIGILAGLTAVSMDLIRKERLSSATSQLLADTQKARLDGMLSSSPTSTTIRGAGIRFESSSSYTIFTFNDCNANYNYDATGCSGNAPEEMNAVSRALSSSISLSVWIGPPPLPSVVVPVVPSNNVVIFDRSGYPRQNTWDCAEVVVVLQNPALSDMKCVHVGTNAIREGVWNGTTCQEK